MSNLGKLYSTYKLMNSILFYKDNSYKVSELLTKEYSTSFWSASSLLDKEKRKAIYALYGFVRLADEIVDTFLMYDKAYLLQKLDEDLQYAIVHHISTNPVLVSFADTVNRYHINPEYISAFMDSMKADLSKNEYKTGEEIARYIYGSADVVGLMCLQIFCDGKTELFDALQLPAQKLGSAFQKVNFLRDLRVDKNELGRSYFPELKSNAFNEQAKSQIEQSIQNDFTAARKGLKRLPGKSKLAVALAFFYYQALFEKIKRKTPSQVLESRIRISDIRKQGILIKTYLRFRLGMV